MGSWRAEAACRGQTELFYGHLGTQAKAVCAGCPVRQECLDEELDRNATEQDNEINGVFGGMTAAERIRLLRTQGRRPVRTHCGRGHEFTPENTLLRERTNKAGEVYESRTCRRCHLDRTNEYKRRKRIGQRESKKDTT